jgi:ABC-type sugar transport system ATPase subunit
VSIEPRNPSQPLLRLAGISKRYGGVHALREAELTIEKPGVVHTLIGANGSGKSTLLGILAGNTRPDAGEIWIEGERCELRTPLDALAKGIAMVSQETAVVPDLTVAENILLGHRQARSWFGISPRRTQRNASEILERLGMECDPGETVGSLRPDQRQMVEIARALSMHARILILDEPTSSLTDDEVTSLFAMVRDLKNQGVATIFVSHRMDDLFTIAEEATVLRDGRTVWEGMMTELDTEGLVSTMVGDGHFQPQRSARSASVRERPTAISLEDFAVPGTLAPTNLEIGEGEIVGLAGISGAGRSEMLEAIFGVRASTGRIRIHGRDWRATSPRAAIEAGIGFLPADRKNQGLSLQMSVRDNLTTVYTLPRNRLARPSRKRETAVATELATAMGVDVGYLDVAVGNLSGGNQQKVALGRWLAVEQSLLLLDEPTRGVDIAAKWEIQRQLKEIASGGRSLLVSSSENDELLELCDRILVLSRGRVVADLSSSEASEAKLTHLAGGGQ